ncbi:hypothetical protein IWQ57_006102, partial [Coemansia nantahalensis]
WISSKLVRSPHLTSYKGKALNAKWHGPYKVVRAIGKDAYTIRLPKTMRIHDVISVDYLKPVKESATYEHLEPLNAPPPIVIDSEA